MQGRQSHRVVDFPNLLITMMLVLKSTLGCQIPGTDGHPISEKEEEVVWLGALAPNKGCISALST